MAQYVALLRGINVGGKNLIKMVDLSACFEKHGFRNVVTYIQSGNVLFEASGTSSMLTTKIEKLLSSTFGYAASVVLRDRKQMLAVVEKAPAGFGKQPEKYRYDVLFLKPPLTAAAAIAKVPIKEGVDEASAGPGVIYHSRLIEKATQSKLNRVVSMPIYKSMTIRNWNTTAKLFALMKAKT